MAGGFFGALAVMTVIGAARLQVPTVGPDGLHLRLLGDAGQAYRLESSSNLTAWTTVTTGVATGGVWEIRLDRPVIAGGRYFRSVQVGAPKPRPAVVPEVRSNFFTRVLVVPDAEASGVVLSPERVRYQFTLGTNAVASSTLVTLTVLTNVAGVPATNGFLAGVRFEPEGLRLSAPFFLEIQFPTNIPARQVSSYAFSNAGTNWQLTPDVVITNRVRILVDRLQSYGCGVFSLEELRAAGPDTGALAMPGARERRAGHLAPQATIEECYPEDEAEAREMVDDIEAKLAPVQAHVAEQLGEERQRQLLGIEDPDAGVSVLAQVMEEVSLVEKEVVDARIPQASQKCATARALMPYVLGFERQRQLLGAGSEDGGMGSGATQLLSAGLQRCNDQAIQCCQSRGGDTRLISFLLGLERQRQLLGISDGTSGEGSVLSGILEACAPKWFGTLTITESGQTNIDHSTAATLSTSEESWRYELVANVASVQEVISEPILFFPGYTNFTFQMVGTVKAAHAFSSHYEDLWDACASGSSLALAAPRLRPHDGGDSLKQTINSSSATNASVAFEISARTMAPGTATLGIAPYLQINTPLFVAALGGRFVSESKTVESTGCIVENRNSAISGSDSYGGHSYLRESGGFQSTGDSIRFVRITPRSQNQMLITTRVELNLTRVK